MGHSFSLEVERTLSHRSQGASLRPPFRPLIFGQGKIFGASRKQITLIARRIGTLLLPGTALVGITIMTASPTRADITDVERDARGVFVHLSLVLDVRHLQRPVQC